MKKITIIVSLFAMLSCSDDIHIDGYCDEEQTTSVCADQERVRSELLAIGESIYNMSIELPYLQVPGYITDSKDFTDIEWVITFVDYVSALDEFGDTIAETDAWYDWLMWYDKYIPE